MENQQKNWVKKNTVWIILLLVVVVCLVLNWGDVIRGWNDGVDAAK